MRKRKAESQDDNDPPKKAKVEEAAGQDVSRTTVIASHLPASMTSDRLSELFSSVGPIRSAFVAKDREDASKNQGYGFIRFVMPEDARQALADLNNSVQEGRKIKVEWAKRRQRQEMEEGTATSIADPPKEKPRWKEVKEQRKVRSTGHESSAESTRTVVIRGLHRSEDTSTTEELKKALYKKAKKLLAKHVGEGQLSVEWPLEVEGKPVGTSVAISRILVSQLNCHVFKGQLLLCCQQFEHEAVTRKGRARGGARLIVRNLGWDVSEGDLSAVFSRYGPLHSVDIPRKADAPDRVRGFAFVWMLRRPDAEKAIAGVNGTEIPAGFAALRIAEGSDNRKKSEKRKSGKEVGQGKGRVVAVDWALSKDQWHAANGGAETIESKEKEEEEVVEQVTDIYGAAPGEQSDGYLSEELSDSDDMMFGDKDTSDEEVESEASESNEAEDFDGDSANENDDQPLQTAKSKGKAVAEGLTLFVRNIQFEATEDELFAVFKRFGPVQYARIAVDAKTGRSRGTGFVHFYRAADAQHVLSESEKLASQQQNAPHQTSNPFSAPSLLQADASSTSARGLTLHGRVLSVSKALSKDDAETMRESRDRANAKHDRRNLYLMREGVVLPDSALSKSLHRSDLQARQSSVEARKNLIRSNPSLFVSRTRLSVRQLPLFVNDRLLGKLARFALKAYDSDVKSGKQPKLTVDELSEDLTDVLGAAPNQKPAKPGKPPPGRIKQAKVVRQDDRVDPLTGQGRSKGYGFLQLANHADALRVLRWLNANSSVGAILRGYWRDDLASQAAALEKEEDGPQKEARKKRITSVALELQAETDRAEAKPSAKGAPAPAIRSTRTLMVEFSIENAVTVKRREEKAQRYSTNLAKKREREEDAGDVGPQAPALHSPTTHGKRTKLDSQPVESARKYGGIGSAIGRKRKEKKMKRAGKA